METEPNWKTNLSEWFMEYRIEAFGTVLRYGPHRQLFKALLSPEDIGQDGWSVPCPDKAYRLGIGSKKTDEVRRARALGSVSVRRGLRHSGAKESVAAVIAPYASLADAQARLPVVASKVIYRHQRNHRHRDDTFLGHIDVVGVDDAMAREHHCVTKGNPLYNQIITAIVDRYLFQILLGGAGESPGWEFVQSIAASQASKIVEILLPDAPSGNS